MNELENLKNIINKRYDTNEELELEFKKHIRTLLEYEFIKTKEQLESVILDTKDVKTKLLLTEFRKIKLEEIML